MLGTYYYHEIIRRTIISFGTLFNNIQIKHENENGDDISLIKVPIAYGPVQKFLARLDEKPDLRKRVAITLPRMSFEMTTIQYDPTRKVSTVQTFQANRSGVGPVKVYMPAPYNIGIQLSIITKYQDDMLQIIEQILPFFQPHFNLSIDLVNSIGEKRDIPIVLDNISMSDDYEGDFSTRRSLVYTLNFTAKTSLFGPISDSSDNLIKKVQVDYYTNTETKNASRQLRYAVEPRALKDYDNDNTATLAQEVNDIITQFNISDASALEQETYIMINEESMYIKNIDGNKLTVLRGQNNTTPAIHEEGDAINVINSMDNQLIEYGDDFGFDEERFDFGDGRVYSPRKGADV
jgi:hypothetical protein